MRQVLEASKTSLEIKKMRNYKKNIVIIFMIIFFMILMYLTEKIYHFNIFFNFILPISSGLLLILISTTKGIFGLNEFDESFLKVMEAIELREKGLQNTDVLKHASNKLMEASKKLDSFLANNKDRISPTWYSDLIDVENKFANNLRYRAVPALQKGMLDQHQLEHIALSFIENNTEQMKVANEIMNEFDEIGRKSQNDNYFILFYRSKLGKLTFSLFFGFTLLFGLIWLYASLRYQNFWNLLDNPSLIIGVGMACSSFVYLVFWRESK